MEKKSKKPSQPKSPKKKGGKRIFVIVVVMVVVLVGLNFLLANKPFTALQAWISREEKNQVYLLYKSFSSRDKAYAQSLLVRQSGAGGYIYQTQEEYRVIYSAYTQKDDAQQVADKNKPIEIITKEIDIENENAEEIYLSLIDLMDYAEQLEEGLIYEAKFLEACSIIRLNLDEKKQKLWQEDNQNKYINVLEIVVGGLSSLNVPGVSRIRLLSDLRYIIISALMSLPS